MPPIASVDLPDELRGLSKIHPQYDKSELEQAHAQLMRHFEDAWQMFVRLEREGLLDDLNLTESKLNPTVNPPQSKSSHPSSKNL